MVFESVGAKVGLIGGILIIISAFLPWATATVLGVTNTFTGIQGAERGLRVSKAEGQD